MNINFYLNNDKRSAKTEKSIFVYVRGLQKYKTLVLNSKLRIDPKYWNAEKQRAKKGSPNEVQINRYLDKYKSKLSEVIQDALNEDVGYSYKQLSNLIKEAFEPKKSSDFFEVFKIYLKKKEDIFQKSTLTKYLTLFNNITKFNDDSNYKISFETLNIKFCELYYNYCINQLGHNNNTAKKQFIMLNTFIKWTIDRGYNNNNEALKYEVKGYKIDIITLSEYELKLLEDYEPSMLFLSHTKDVFLLSIYTGQRFSDIHNLKFEDIDYKNKIWKLRTTKTKDLIKIPLSNQAIKIIDKYKDEEAFIPTISNQKFNENLKNLCKNTGIDEPVTITIYQGNKRVDVTKPKYELISSHTARRTFVTLSLIKGMQPHILMKITGHKDYKTLDKYIRIDNKVTQDEVKKIWG